MIERQCVSKEGDQQSISSAGVGERERERERISKAGDGETVSF